MLFSFKTFAQSGFELRGGIGFVELVHVGIKYNCKISPGVNVGIYDPFVKRKSGLFVIEPCVYYHFSHKDDSSERKPWYVKNGLTWLRINPDEKYLFFTARFGGEIFFTDHLGVSIGVGGSIEIWSNFEPKLIDLPLLPSLGICLLCKL